MFLPPCRLSHHGASSDERKPPALATHSTSPFFSVMGDIRRMCVRSAWPPPERRWSSISTAACFRVLGGGLHRQWHHQDFIHAVAVHIDDLKTKSTPRKMITGCGDAPELLHHKTA